MKTAALLLALTLASCAPPPAAWHGTPNPLDVPAIAEPVHPASGYWGPFGIAPASFR